MKVWNDAIVCLNRDSIRIKNLPEEWEKSTLIVTYIYPLLILYN